MKSNGSPPPEFGFDEDHSCFLVRLPVHKKEKLAPNQQGVAGEVTAQVEALLRVIDAELSREDLQTRLNLADRENFQKSFLIPSIEAGLIERAIPGKPNSRLQKYRLTEKGRALLPPITRDPCAMPASHHWATERSLTTLCPDHVWKVSAILDPRRSNGEKELVELAGKSLLLPKNEAFHPDAMGLRRRCDQLIAS